MFTQVPLRKLGTADDQTPKELEVEEAVIKVCHELTEGGGTWGEGILQFR